MDDLSESFLKLAQALQEKMLLDHLDVLVVVCKRMCRAFGSVRFSGDDFKGAFKTLPNRNEDLPLLLLLLACRPDTDVPRVIVPLATPFGSVGPVHAWHRFGHVCAFVLNVLFLLPTIRHLDGLSRAEGASLADSGRRDFVASGIRVVFLHLTPFPCGRVRLVLQA